MMFLPLLAGMIGIAASGALILCSVIFPRWFVSIAVHRLDTIQIGVNRFSRRESMAIGVLLHLIFSLFFGAVFGSGLVLGIAAMNAISMFWLFVLMSLVFGGIILPLEGHGLFGWKEDHWIPIDLLAMNALWVSLFWVLLAVLI